MNPVTEMDRSKSKKVELIIQQLNSLPTLPAVAARLLQLTVKQNTQAADIVQLIESDQALASKIIMMATRTNRCMSRRSASVSKAVVSLGFDAVRNSVLSIKVFETLGKAQVQESAVFDRKAFWKHSLAVACAAKMLIRHIDRKIDPEEAFLCGLLHDMGKVALDACLPKSFARVVQVTESTLGNIAEVEQKLLGIDHTVVGKRLAEKWNMPQSIVETVWLHHQNPAMLPDGVQFRSLIQTVYLADLVTREQRIGYSGTHLQADSANKVAQSLGCPADSLEKVIRDLRKDISERSLLLGLDEIEPEDLYQEALVDANGELGILNDQLHEQNRKLGTRNQYFELFQRLGQKLQSGQTVVDVCSLLAELWAEHSSSPYAAAYVSHPNEKIIEGGMKTDSGPRATVFLVDGKDDPQLKEAGAASWLPAGFTVGRVDEKHNWFFEQVAAMFEPSLTLAMPLRTGGETLGGILWQAADPQVDYGDQLSEVEAFATMAAMALSQARKQDEQSRLCEQLARSNQMLHSAQHELLQNRSMVAVGEMACGAAHEINNPLAVVVGRSQLLFAGEQDEEKRAMLEAINRQGREIADIISELMEFAKPSTPQSRSCRAADLVSRMVSALSDKAVGQKVEIVTAMDEYLPEVFVDPGQIADSLGELIANAIESYQGRVGTVRITGREEELEGNVVIEIIDQGCGMDKETLEKAFSPFFSQRQSGRGRGLGLSRANRHIAGNGGHLNLYSEPGRGTMARVTLPVSRIPSMAVPMPCEKVER
jgi:putative nucleotidyltransferase with HDIG domain